MQDVVNLQIPLRPGERLLWSGRPDPAVRFAPSDAFVVPFSVMWTGFTVFWELEAVATDAPLFFRLWGIPFLAVGGYFTIGRFVVKARKKRRTSYAVTDHRALVLIGGRVVSDMPLRDQPLTIRRSRSGRHVSVVLGSGLPWPRAGAYANTGLDGIEFTGGPQSAFYDVADPEPLLAALDAARAPRVQDQV